MKAEQWWCTEVAAGALLTFLNVVTGDIGDHWRSSLECIFESISAPV